jgi:hypothetical protein
LETIAGHEGALDRVEVVIGETLDRGDRAPLDGLHGEKTRGDGYARHLHDTCPATARATHQLRPGESEIVTNQLHRRASRRLEPARFPVDL